MDGSRWKSPPWGLFGGEPGGKGGIVLRGGASGFEHGSGTLHKGEIIEVITAGSGGYGPPAERGADEVRRDVVEARTAAAVAREMYGI